MSEVTKKICPHCGGTQFMAYVKRGCIVESEGINEDDSPKFKLVKEGAKENYELEILKCAKCQHNVTEADLIAGSKCKKCGKPVNPNDLNEEGLCPVCSMLATNPAIANMSADDLRFMLAKVLQQSNSVKKDIDAKTEKAEQVEAKAKEVTEQKASVDAADTSGDNVLNDILGGEAAPAEQQPEEKPKRKRRAVKKSTETVAPESETASEKADEEKTDEPEESAEETLSENQDAPFPDVTDGMMNVPEEQAAPQAAAAPTTGGGFQMFDDEEDTDQPF